MSMKIALSQEKFFDHSTNWFREWQHYCEEKGIACEVIDFYQNGILERLAGFDAMLWHFSGYVPQDMKFARSILYACRQKGIRTFPDFNTVWHFDDKIAETYLLEAAQAPVVKSWMFYQREEALAWLEGADYPLVAKLRCGSGSHNVLLIRSRNQARRYVNKMFGRGFTSSPNILFKVKSNYKSSASWQQRLARLKRAREFFRGWTLARKFPRENGYVFFQEFVPNAGYDIKVVVVGDKCTFLTRPVRENDFRASGGGAVAFDRDLVPDNVVASAFAVADRLQFQSMGFDYVVDQRDGIGRIVEISYGFSNEALMGSGGYWDRSLTWHQEPFNPAREVIENLVRECLSEPDGAKLP